MKIGVVSSTVFPCPPSGYSGLEMIAYQVATGLAGKGHEVTLFAPDGSQCPGGKVFAFGPPGRIDDKIAYSRYWGELKELDCIIDHSWSHFPLIGKKEGWLRCPSLTVLHAPVNTCLQSLPPGVERPCFVCISDDQKAHFEALFSHPAKRAYNGVDLTYYQKINIPRSDRFLFLARFSSIKGADICIRACLKSGVGLDLIGDVLITGEPGYLELCQQLAKQSSPQWDHSKGQQIRIIGGVSRGEAVWWYSQAHCFLHGAKPFREPFGLAPVEAMACETPVIAFDSGALRETIYHLEHFDNLVKTEDEFAQAILYAKNHITSSDRSRCKENAGRFSLQNMIDGYDTLVKDAVENGGW